MRNQVKNSHNLGVSAVSLLSGIESDEEAMALEWKREISVLHGTRRVVVEDRTMETNA